MNKLLVKTTVLLILIITIIVTTLVATGDEDEESLEYVDIESTEEACTVNDIGTVKVKASLSEKNEDTKKIEETSAEPSETESITVPKEEDEAVQESQKTEETSTEEVFETNATTSTSSFWKSERELLAYVVWGEISITDDAADYKGAYLQACVVLNRVKSSEYPNTITEVIYQSGQWVPSWYEELKSTGRMPNTACYEAVDDALSNNTTPDGLLYSDCRETVPSGTYLYYKSPTGQRFYSTN